MKDSVVLMARREVLEDYGNYTESVVWQEKNTIGDVMLRRCLKQSRTHFSNMMSVSENNQHLHCFTREKMESIARLFGAIHGNISVLQQAFRISPIHRINTNANTCLLYTSPSPRD